MINANPVAGTMIHAIGAILAATCYTPQKRVRRWSWQTYWMVQAAFCWFLLPIIGAWLTIPDLFASLAEAPRDAMLRSFLLGAAYGIGGTAFGIAIRYIGFSLTYALAVGLSSVLGTLIPPMVRGEFGDIFSKVGAGWVLCGIAIGTLGIILCGLSGWMKERDLEVGAGKQGFSIAKGLPLCLLAGVLSAVYGFALEAGAPIAEIAEVNGAGYFNGNITYIFSNTGAFVTTLLYCLYLSTKHKTLGELVELPAGEEKASLPVNFLMAVVTGLFWYGQFFFYNLGHVRMGTFKFTSWAIHMIMLVLFSNVLGLVLREWKGCRQRTWTAVALSLAVLITAVLMLTYGNRKAELAAPPVVALSAGKTAAVSSQGSEDMVASALTDGKPETFWSPSDQDKAPWAEIDLGAPAAAGCVKITEAAGRIRKARIEFRETAEAPWTLLTETNAVGGKFAMEFGPVTGRYFRLSVPESTRRCALREFQVFAPVAKEEKPGG